MITAIIALLIFAGVCLLLGVIITFTGEYLKARDEKALKREAAADWVAFIEKRTKA